MAWNFSQKTGQGTWQSDARAGHSGPRAGLDYPTFEQEVGVGPMPKGEWIIGQFFDDPGGKGPLVAHLLSSPQTDTHGRGGFMIHGDNTAANNSASEGCIVLPRWIRELI